MTSDIRSYFRFTGKARVEKSVNSLLGLLEGIAIDGTITSGEIALLRIWLADHQDVAERHPFSELIPVVVEAISDGVLDAEERKDLTWLCERLQSAEFFDKVTADVQRLHAIVGAIAFDGVISVEELRGLSEWLTQHDHLLKEFFSEFLAVLDERTIVSPVISDRGEKPFTALCAVMPSVSFPGSTFCFTGASAKCTRAEFEKIVRTYGGNAVNGVTEKLTYLVIGASGNPCWAYACYGRKVEKAVKLRKKGLRIVLVHENDFHDAVLDA